MRSGSALRHYAAASGSMAVSCGGPIITSEMGPVEKSDRLCRCQL